MLDINFLTPRDLYHGMEFLDFQPKDMYNSLVSEFNSAMEINNKGVAEIANLNTTNITNIIEEYTGFNNVNIDIGFFGNLSVDVGYFSPNHIFNTDGLDKFFPADKTTIGRWFKQNKTKVFKGDINYKTGKVSGNYANIPLTITINKNVSSFLKLDVLTKYNATPAQVLAAFLCHEIGHAFSMLMTIHQSFYDNFVIRSTIFNLSNTKKESDRAVIIKESKELLEIDKLKSGEDKELIEKIVGGDDDACLIYLYNRVNERNASRALSVGVKDMSAEVVADMYAIRMGCGREIVAGLAGVLANSVEVRKGIAKFFSIVMSVYYIIGTMLLSPLLGILLLPVIVVQSIAAYFTIRLILFVLGGLTSLTPDSYNTAYRRMTDAVGQMVSQLKTDKTISPTDKLRIINDAEQALKIANDFKPLFEDTMVQRLVGSVFTLGKFKYTNFEHYTQNIANHKFNIVAEKFNLGV